MAQSVLDRIREQVSELTPEEVKEQLAKLQAAKAEKTVKGTKKRAASGDPEKRKAYARERSQDPAVKERQREYRNRPEVKERQRQYRQERYKRQQELIKKAMALGITGEEKEEEKKEEKE